MTFERAVNFVMDLEGGYTNDPQDHGGETRWGITKRDHPEIDIPTLTRDQAAEIYRKAYWNICKCDQLPSGINLLVFDCAVNQGTDKAARLLQRSLKVEEDGVIGPETLNAAKEAGSSLVAELAAQRMLAYGSIPQFTRYGLGWSRRLMKVVVQCLS